MNTIGSSIPTIEQTQLKTVGKKELGKSDFMTLFITQLQYQDPMKPMDSYEMASQLAQFSNMDATMKMSENMEKLLDYQTSQNNIQLLTLIDKNVQASGSLLAVNGGTSTATEFSLDSSADVCVVDVYDGSGRLVRTIDMGKSPAGTYELAWDGKDSRGDAVPDGTYRYQVEALDSTGQEVGVETRVTGRVTGIDFNNGKATLAVDKQIGIDVSDIISVM